MNIALWIVQILLAAFFLTVGSIKLVIRKDRLAKVLEWIDDFTQNKIRMIGALEVIGALGLFLPGVYSVGTFLIPLAAVCLEFVMVIATYTHYQRGERSEMFVNISIIVLLALVAILRLAFFPLAA